MYEIDKIKRKVSPSLLLDNYRDKHSMKPENGMSKDYFNLNRKETTKERLSNIVNKQ